VQVMESHGAWKGQLFDWHEVIFQAVLLALLWCSGASYTHHASCLDVYGRTVKVMAVC
jgi:hypothetical protein